MTQDGCNKGNGEKEKAVSLKHYSQSQLKHTHLTHTLSEKQPASKRPRRAAGG